MNYPSCWGQDMAARMIVWQSKRNKPVKFLLHSPSRIVSSHFGMINRGEHPQLCVMQNAQTCSLLSFMISHLMSFKQALKP